MHPDDLNVIWICHECKSKFVFNSDVEQHRARSAHLLIQKYDLFSGRLIDGIDVTN
jgi:hypothetical protein